MAHLTHLAVKSSDVSLPLEALPSSPAYPQQSLFKVPVSLPSSSTESFIVTEEYYRRYEPYPKVITYKDTQMLLLKDSVLYNSVYPVRE